MKPLRRKSPKNTPPGVLEVRLALEHGEVEDDDEVSDDDEGEDGEGEELDDGEREAVELEGTAFPDPNPAPSMFTAPRGVRRAGNTYWRTGN